MSNLGSRRIRDVEDLVAWQKACDLAELVITTCSGAGAVKERWLRDQLCRAATSIAANVAEGWDRNGSRELRHFLSIAKGSAGELRTLAHIASRTRLMPKSDAEQIRAKAWEVSRIIGGLIRSIDMKSRASNPTPTARRQPHNS